MNVQHLHLEVAARRHQWLYIGCANLAKSCAMAEMYLARLAAVEVEY